MAFKNPDGSIAVLVLNDAQTPSTFSLNWKGKMVSYSLPAQAVATFYWQGYSGNTFDVTAGPGSQTVAPGGSTFYSVDVNRYGNDHGNNDLKVEGLPGDAFGEPVPIPFTDQYLLPVVAERNATSGSYPADDSWAAGECDGVVDGELHDRWCGDSVPWKPGDDSGHGAGGEF